LSSLSWVLVGVVGLLLGLVAARLLLDVLRAVRFLAGARRLAPVLDDEHDEKHVAWAPPSKKLTPEEAAGHRRALWAQLYRPGLSPAKLDAFRALREQHGAFLLDAWMWRLWWRAWCRLASEATGQVQKVAITQAKGVERSLYRAFSPADLALFLSLYAPGETPRLELAWAQQQLKAKPWRRHARRRLESLAETQGFVGEAAFVALVEFLVQQRAKAQVVPLFARLRPTHPQAAKRLEPALRELFSATVDMLSLPFGGHHIALCSRASSGSFHLSPLHFDVSAATVGEWMCNPPVLSSGRKGEQSLQGSLGLIRFPFMNGSLALFSLPPLRGAFLLELRVAPAPSRFWSRYLDDIPLSGAEHREHLQHTQLDAVLNLTEGGASLWVLDRESRRPVRDASASFWRLEAPGAELCEHPGRTDPDGLVGLPDAAYWQLGACVAREGSHGATEFLFLTHDVDISTAERSKPEERLYVWLARPLYRPGETVQGKLVARAKGAVGPSTRLASGRGFRLEVRGPRGNSVATLELTLSRFGSASFSFAVPAGAPLGRYSFALKHHHLPTRVEGSLQVEEFVAPEFRASLRSLVPPRWRQPATVEFEASYFFGGPVAGARGTLELRRRCWSYRRGSGWPPARELSTARALRTLRFETDAAGQARITVPWSGPLDLLRRHDGHDLELKATLRDASGKTCEATLELSFRRLSHLLEITPSETLRLPGEPLPLALRWFPEETEEPVEHELTVELRGGSGRRRRKVRVSTAQREVSVPLDLHPGAWNLTGSLAGQRRPTQLPVEVWVLGEEVHSAFPRLLVSRGELSEAAPVRVAFVGPRGNGGLCVLLVHNRGAVLGASVLGSAGSAAWMDLLLPQGTAPRIFLQAWSPAPATGHGLWHIEASLSAPPAKALPPPSLGPSLSLDFPSATLRPGAATVLSASLDDAGTPASELVCSVVDEALFSVVPAPRPAVQFFEESPPELDMKPAWSAAWASAQAGRQPPVPIHAVSEKLGAMILAPPFGLQGLPMAQAAGPMGGLGMALGAPAPGPPMAMSSVPRKSAGPFRARKEMMSRGGGGDEIDMQAEGGAGASDEVSASTAAPVALRSDFSSEAAWFPEVPLERGVIRLPVQLPDTLTTWKATALLICVDDRLSEAEARVRTQKPLMVRLQAPRFFQERDTFVLRALVDSRVEQALLVRASLEAPGLSLQSSTTFELTIPAGGQQKLEAQALVPAGSAPEICLRASAAAEQEPDAADLEERRVPFRPYGVARRLTAQGKLSGGRERVTLALPEQRKPECTRLTVRLDRGPLDVVLHALEYLREYPYGCVEQTCSRLLPHLVWERVLGRDGLGREELSVYRAAARTPSHDDVDAGLEGLLSMQNPDGGFGWWPSRGSDVWMTSYVLFSFSIARRPDAQRLQAARRFLCINLLNTSNPDDADAFAAFSLAWSGATVDPRVFEVLLPRWDSLSLTEQAKLCLPLRAARHPEAAAFVASVRRKLVRSARKFVRKVADDETPDGSWFVPRATEAIAFFVLVLLHEQAPARAEPGDPAEPEPPEAHGETLALLASFLLLHRRGSRWHSTRDTALAVLALLAYEEHLGGAAGKASLTISLNGQEKLSAALGDREHEAPWLRLSDEHLHGGDNVLELSTEGLDAGAIAHHPHYSAELEFYSVEDTIAPTEAGIRLERVYWLVDDKQKASRRLKSGERVQVGQRIRVVFTLKSERLRRYLLLEDPRLAGCEPVAKKSGREACEGDCDHVELRADRTAIFLSVLGERSVELSYDIEAQLPGTFTAMPASAETMYESEVSGTSGSFSLTIDSSGK
jgi:alpha-2-macroglobulin